MKAIELFAGIGGFHVAANQCGIDMVWANDISPKACEVYRTQFGKDSIIEGDVRQFLNFIPRHDLLTAGFPCQPFSSAGKKKGIRDARGTLFETIILALEKYSPRYFILENVKRLLAMEDGYHFATILSSLANLNYSIEWRLLNAMHLGLPKNRQRVFIIGMRRTASDASPEIKLASEEDLSSLPWSASDCLPHLSEWKQIEKHGKSFPNWGLAIEGRFFGADLDGFSEQQSPVLLKKVLQKNVGNEFDFTETTLKWVETNTPVKRFVQGVEIISNQGGGARMGYTIFGTNGVAPTLTSSTSRHYERYRIGERYRRLTNIEYARIQGFPDDHCAAVSTYDQYALYGNAVPPPMVKWVMEKIVCKGNRPQSTRQKQMGLFK